MSKRRHAVLNVVGLTPRLIGEHTPWLQRFLSGKNLTRVRPQVPAVTCTMQATYLTGRRPSEHGIVGNGWFHRELAEHQFWKQSNRLVHGEKLWETMRKSRPGYTCAKVFWWYNMYSTADYSITPRPLYPADGRKIFDVHTQPMEWRQRIKADLGDFPFPAFWGPAAGLASSQWIARSAKWIEEQAKPALSLIYLPHLDYDCQRYGPEHPKSRQALREIDALLADLVPWMENRDIQVCLLSEYGITAVSRPIHLNRHFRGQGWLSIKDELGLETLDLGSSTAFAIADHQLAHVYVARPENLPKVRDFCAGIPGVESVWDRDQQRAEGLNHERAGDLVLIADKESWFTYYYWLDEAKAPDFARCVDIHRKPGYDPVELFLNPKLCCPKLKIVTKLLRKKLGFRMLMDVVPLDAELVRGSHGRIPEDQDDWPILIAKGLSAKETVEAQSVRDLLLGFLGT